MNPVEGLEPRQLLAAQVYDGPLTGKVVYTSAGHGWQYNDTLGRYATDRGDNNEVVEDFGNQDQLTFYADYLLRAGATVVPMRPVGNQTREIVLDNDSSGVTFTGAWSNSGSAQHYDEDYGAPADSIGYRFAGTTAGAETSVATYQPNFAAEGFYPVYTWVLSSANRTTQLYRVNHTGGSTEIRVDHRMVGKGWVYLGTYHFNAGSAASGNVQVSNSSPVAGSVIADAIRFGNGMGDFVDTAAGAPGISRYPREDENSYHWIRRSLGQGVTVGGSIGTTSNVSAPSEMAEWMHSGPFGSAVYIGFHSNAGGGRGAVGLIDSDQGTRNQSSLALYTGRQINADMQALNGSFEHAWSTRNAATQSTYTSGFGEIDLGAAAEMDATIIEVAFHDSVEDAALMRDPKARDQMARSTYEATLEYFDNFGGLTAPASQPDEPTNVRATANAAGDVTVTWSAPAARAGGPGAATAYRVYTSRNGYGFSNPVQVTGTSLTFPAAQLDGSAYYFKVAGVNAGGESPGSVVVGARKNGTGGGGGTNRVLVVNGFDRNERSQNQRYVYAHAGDGLTDRVRTRYNNSFDYVARAGEAIEAFNAGGAALGFDSVQNEHVTSGAVNLANYQTVIWLAGEESTAHETFSNAEQSVVASFLGAGGRLFVSGAEIGWDLDRPTGPTAGDRGFYNSVLRADYAADDGGSYTTSGATGSIFAGLSLAFDNGTNGTYNVDTPDRLAPFGGSTVALNYTGTGSGGAAIQYTAGLTGPRVVNLGLPFETITTAANRNLVMARVLTFFNTALSPSVTPGAPDLVASSDSGRSSTDNLTRRDNTASRTLQFAVPGTVAGATVRVYADGVEIGSAAGVAGSTTVTTTGTLTLANGARVITARQTESGKDLSPASASLTVTVDTVAPAVQLAQVTPDLRTTPVDSIDIVFSERVYTFGIGDLTLTRTSDGTGSELLTPAQTLTSADDVTFTLNNLGVLTSKTGEYALSVTPSPTKAITDAAGNFLASLASDTWVHSLPAWLAPGSVATWDTATKALTVTGAATITSDPGPDSPVITANGPAAVLTINPSSGRAVHVGGLTLTGGATATLASVASEATATAVTLDSSTRKVVRGGAARPSARPKPQLTSLAAAAALRTAANSRVLVVQGNTFDVDADSTLDLADNNLILDYAGATSPATAVEAMVRAGFNGGDWLGNRVTSSAAHANRSYALAVADNARLAVPFGDARRFAGEAVGTTAVLVKFTHRVDLDLDGVITTNDATIFNSNYSEGAPARWGIGDVDYDGLFTSNDATLFNSYYDETLGAV